MFIAVMLLPSAWCFGGMFALIIAACFGPEAVRGLLHRKGGSDG